MFAGRFDHALDEKGRTMMPKRFRERLAVTDDRTVWMTRSLDGTHLEVRPSSSFKAYFARVSAAKATKLIKLMKRRYFGAALEVEVDAAGRLLVPASLRKELDLGDKIAFCGADEHYFEIWKPEALDKTFKAVEDAEADLEDQLAEHGL